MVCVCNHLVCIVCIACICLFYYMYTLVHFTMMSTEHSYDPGSPQYTWLQNDLKQAVANRNNVPWIMLVGHRPMYSADKDEFDSHTQGAHFQQTIEPLMLEANVDMYFCGHMHIYERVNSVANGTVKAVLKGGAYVDAPAPIHIVQGNAGVFEDVQWIDPIPSWSADRKSRIGYGRMQVFNATHLFYESLELETRKAMDSFWVVQHNH
eukprot:m.36896 g.36896  ORF g.36896 m.36896 type:complete len:208 (-) comp10049_c0_seq1:140-763(-)